MNILKKTLINVIKKILTHLEQQDNTLEDPSVLDKNAYKSLSPTSNADKQKKYDQVIKWALDNRAENDIKNIAITGPFGSGKSSVIKTFQKNNADYKILNISLASFKDNNDSNINGSISQDKYDIIQENENKLRSIELSILQQIFYHESDKTIPDSRFRRIKSIKRSSSIWYSLGIIFLVIFVANLINTQLLINIIKVEINPGIEAGIYYLSLIYTLIASIYILYKLNKFGQIVEIKKFNIYNTEIEIKESINKSILNNNIDEILYFFEVSSYDIVIFEDLDRFENTDIFTKLREINLLINNSKNINKSVVFIYSVKDDIFINKDRTKFFDFIIPIIPIINVSNSKSLIISNRDENSYILSNEFIAKISLFIDDMRILNNILNEYKIYSTHINKSLNQEKLFSLIVYKNLYPKDFILLNNNQGKLVDFINNKQTMIDSSLKKIDNKINYNNEEIIKLDNVQNISLIELRSLYMYKYLTHINNFHCFVIENKDYTIQESIDENIFKYFAEDKVFVKTLDKGRYDYEIKNINVSFKEIEKQIDEKLTYNERVTVLTTDIQIKIKELRQLNKSLELEKQKINSRSISEVLSMSDSSSHDDNNENQVQLIYFLVRYGYVDEQYINYISFFHEGGISLNEHDFLINVICDAKPDFSIKLTNISLIINDLGLFSFNKSSILNVSLIDHIFKYEQYKEHKLAIINTTIEYSLTSFDFLITYLEKSDNSSIFISYLLQRWDDILISLFNSKLQVEQENEFVLNVILLCDINRLKIINKNNILSAYISKKFNFVFKKLEFIENINEILLALEIKFTSLYIDDHILYNSDKFYSLAEKILTNDSYEINYENMNLLIKFSNEEINSLNQINEKYNNYDSIINLKHNSVVNYINNNILTYIDNIYLTKFTNSIESNISLLNLLNNETIDRSRKENILKITNSKINNLDEIVDDSLFDIVIKYKKIYPSWSNISIYFNSADTTFTADLINFLNDKAIAEELARQELSFEDTRRFQLFIKQFLAQDNIIDANFELILSAITSPILDLELSKFSQNRINLLVSKNIIEFDDKNFDYLYYSNNSNYLFLFEQNVGSFENDSLSFDIYQSYKFSLDDKIYLLTSLNVSENLKNLILEDKDIIECINENESLVIKIKDFIISANNLTLKPNVITSICCSTFIELDDRFIILSLFIDTLAMDQILFIFSKFPFPYSLFLDNKKNITVPFNDIFVKICEKLKNRNIIMNFRVNESGIRKYNK